MAEVTETTPLSEGLNLGMVWSPATQKAQAALESKVKEREGLTEKISDITEKIEPEILERSAPIYKAYRDTTGDLEKQYDKDRLEIKAFAPTQNNIQNLGNLFSLIATAGVMGGGASKLGAMNAMSAMTGMLKGYQDGNLQEYEKQEKEYELSIQQIKDHNADVLRHYENALRLAATDREESLKEMEMAVRKGGSNSIAAIKAQQGQMDKSIEILRAQARALEQHDLISQRQKETQDAAQDRLDQSQEFQREMQKQRLSDQRQREEDKEEAKSALKSGAAYALKQRYAIPNEELSRLTDKEMGSVAGTVEAARVTAELADLVEKNPTAVGIAGTILSKIDKYIPSRYANSDASQAAPVLKSGIDSDTSLQGKPDDIATARVIAKKALDVINARALAVSSRLLVSELRMQKEVLDIGGMPAKSVVPVYRNLAKDSLDSLKKVGFSDETIYSLESKIIGSRGKPAASAAKPLPSADKLKVYADQHFNGDVDAATKYLKDQGYQ